MHAAHHLLVDLVRDKELHATQRVFLFLELLDGNQFDDIWRGLRSKIPKLVASSLELLENLIKPPLRARILALVGDNAAARNSEVPLTYEETIRRVLAHRSSTLRTLAEYRAIELGIDSRSVPRTSLLDLHNPLAENLGGRLVGRARHLLTPDDEPKGVTRAPA